MILEKKEREKMENKIPKIFFPNMYLNNEIKNYYDENFKQDPMDLQYLYDED